MVNGWYWLTRVTRFENGWPSVWRVLVGAKKAQVRNGPVGRAKLHGNGGSSVRVLDGQ